MKRYEVLLPEKFNDGSSVPRELLADTADEIRGRFGAVSLLGCKVCGQWIDGSTGIVFDDEMVRLFVDAEDAPMCYGENLIWFRKMKEVWEERFDQRLIYITCFKIKQVI